MEEQQLSEFNMAVAYMNRLHTLLVACDQSSMALDSFGWYSALGAIFRELSPELKAEQTDTFKAIIERLNPLVKDSSRMSKKGIFGINDKLYFELQDLEIALRRVMQERGLYNKVSRDPSKAIYG